MSCGSHQKSPFSFDLWVEEIRRLRSRIEEEFEVTITDEDIWEAIDLVNREKKLLKEISDLNQLSPPPISGIDLLTVTWSSGFSYDKKEVIRMLEALKNKLESRESEPEAAQKPRILLTGCPVGLGSERSSAW